MYLLVHALAELGEELVAGQVFQLVNPLVDGCAAVVVDATLVAEDACLHVVEVVLTALLEGRVVALLLELLRLEVVAGVVLVGDGQRNDVQLAEVATHGKHFENRLLGVVAGVLGTALALGYPDVFVFLGDGIVDIAAHEL